MSTPEERATWTNARWLAELKGDGEVGLDLSPGDPVAAWAHKRILELEGLINSPEIELFLRGTRLEAIHQVERWGTAHDRAKRPADWFWLVGYLAGKALHAQTAGNTEKALHHCISTAAALFNWHSSIKGVDVRMAPGRSDIAEIVDAAFPGEAAPDKNPVITGLKPDDELARTQCDQSGCDNNASFEILDAGDGELVGYECELHASESAEKGHHVREIRVR